MPGSLPSLWMPQETKTRQKSLPLWSLQHNEGFKTCDSEQDMYLDE